MAVSKTQNERPAIVDLIDLANQLEDDSDTNARNIESLAEANTSLQNQLGNGFAETSVTQSLNATNEQVTLLGDAQAALADSVTGILDLLDNIKFGLTGPITVQANTTSSNSYVYPEPFDTSAKSFAFLGFADAAFQTTLSVTLLESTYSGFRYSISNTGTDPATVNVGYLALAVIPLS